MLKLSWFSVTNLWSIGRRVTCPPINIFFPFLFLSNIHSRLVAQMFSYIFNNNAATYNFFLLFLILSYPRPFYLLLRFLSFFFFFFETRFVTLKICIIFELMSYEGSFYETPFLIDVFAAYV